MAQGAKERHSGSDAPLRRGRAGCIGALAAVAQQPAAQRRSGAAAVAAAAVAQRAAAGAQRQRRRAAAAAASAQRAAVVFRKEWYRKTGKEVIEGRPLLHRLLGSILRDVEFM